MIGLTRLSMLGVAGLAAVVLVALPGNAPAAVPGVNGKIVFVRELTTPDGCCQDVIMTTEGSPASETQLTNPESGDVPGFDEDPVYSPDGSRIAFARELDNQTGIWVMNADGSNQHELTSGPDDQPAWSPDGTEIVFVSDRDGSDGDLFAVNADGTGAVRRLTTDGGNDEPAWSPDGTKIAFTHYYAYQPPDDVSETDIVIMNADGTGRVNFTNDPDWDDRDPVWSPDGRQIAFASDHGDRFSSHIWRMDSAATGGAVFDAVQLTFGDEEDTSPAWAPDGSQIVYDSDRATGFPDLYTMGSDGTLGDQVTHRDLPNGNVQSSSPDWQPVPPDATIRVGEASSPADDPGRFDLLIDQTVVVPAAGNGASNFLYESAGTYTVSEDAAAGTSLGDYTSSVACLRNGQSWISTPGTSVQVTAAPGDSISCTFTNTRNPLPAQVTVRNALVPANDPGRFDLLVDQTTVAAAAGNGDSGSTTVPAGTHTISESAGAGTSLADYTQAIACTLDGGPGPSGTGPSLGVTLAAGDSLDCTITNTRIPSTRAHVTVHSSLLPPADSGRFDLQVGKTVVKAAAGNGDSGSTDVAPGTYAVREIAALGTALSDYTVTHACTLNGAPGVSGKGAGFRVSLAAGDQLDCTFTSTRKATVTVTNALVPGDDPGRFDLHVSGAVVRTAAGDGDSGEREVAAGTVTVRETPAPGTTAADYTTSIACTIDGNPGPAGTGRALQVTVGPADSLACVFTNSRKPTVTLASVLQPAGDPGRFDLRVVGVGIVVGDAGNGDSGTRSVAPGVYTIKETAAAGPGLGKYTTSIACTLNGAPGPSAAGTTVQVAVASGDALACTFTNIRR